MPDTFTSYNLSFSHAKHISTTQIYCSYCLRSNNVILSCNHNLDHWSFVSGTQQTSDLTKRPSMILIIHLWRESKLSEGQWALIMHRLALSEQSRAQSTLILCAQLRCVSTQLLCLTSWFTVCALDMLICTLKSFQVLPPRWTCGHYTPCVCATLSPVWTTLII